MNESNTSYLPARKVRERYDVSDMTLWRWLKDPDLNFPKPMRINNRRLWNNGHLDAFDERQAARSI